MAYTPTDNPYIPGDPYSYDLKWIVAKIKEALSGIEGLTTGQSDLSNDFEELKEYVYNYFDNLDISQEVEDKINELYAAGFFDSIIEGWMNSHIKWTNPNLIMNSWFTVRQRGDGPFSGNNTYFADRWTTSDGNNATITGSNNGITWVTTTNNQTIRQRLPLGTLKRGEVYTLSFEEDGTIYTATSVTIPATFGTEWSVIASWNLTAKTQLLLLEGNGTTTDATIQLSARDASVRNIRAIKLEKGPYSTLANDTPPNYEDELEKCLYYFERISAPPSVPFILGYGYADGTNYLYVPVYIHRKRSGISNLSSSGSILAGNPSLTITASSISNYGSSSSGFIFIAVNAPNSFTGNGFYRLAIAAGGYIDLSADI